MPWGGGVIDFGRIFGFMIWSFAVLPVAANYRMSSVQDFLVLETCFTALPSGVVSPLIAPAYRVGKHDGAPAMPA